MRRHQRMQYRDSGKYRQPGQEIGVAFESLGVFCQARADIEDDGHHQHHAGFEEQRQAQDHGHRAHGPGDHACAAHFQQRGGDAFGSARTGQQLAEHGAQRQQHADIGQGLAETHAETFQHLLGGSAGPQAKHQRSNHQCRKGMHPQPGDGKNHAQDDDKRNTKQKQIVLRHLESPRIRRLSRAFPV